MKKVLFRPIENEKDKPLSPDPVDEVEDSCQVCETWHFRNQCLLWRRTFQVLFSFVYLVVFMFVIV